MSTFLDSCPLCHARTLAHFLSARDVHYGIPGTYDLARCSECSLVFVNPMYSGEELTSLYPSDYYAYAEEPALGKWKRIAKRLLGYWQGTKEPYFLKPGTFLDVGCGSGSFLRNMAARGWDSYGVEVNRAATDLGCFQGLKIHPGTLQEARFPSAYFDYVRASHSFEHISCPHETLDEIHRILKPSGVLLLAVPNIDSVTARMFKSNWWHLCPPIHPLSYSPRTLTRLLAQHSFDIKRVVFNSDYVGLLGSIQIWLNDGLERPSAGNLFRSKPLRVLSGWVERFYDLARRGDMFEITAAPVL